MLCVSLCVNVLKTLLRIPELLPGGVVARVLRQLLASFGDVGERGRVLSLVFGN